MIGEFFAFIGGICFILWLGGALAANHPDSRKGPDDDET